MASMRYLVHFFRVVPPNPPLMGVALAATTLAGAATLAIDPGRAREVLTPVLLLQLFASSSGLIVPARRGHYDLLLTMGYSRVAIASVHWTASALPGIASWAVLGSSEIVLARTSTPLLMTSGTVAALVLVSTVPWALTAALPRFAGAIGWLVVLALLAATAPALDQGRLFERPGGGASWLQAAIAVLLYPPLLVGEDLRGPQVLLVVPALVVAASALGYALVTIERRDIPLEAAQ